MTSLEVMTSLAVLTSLAVMTPNSGSALITSRSAARSLPYFTLPSETLSVVIPVWSPPKSFARDVSTGRNALSMPNIAAGERSLWPTSSSARCCTQSVLSSCARMGFS